MDNKFTHNNNRLGSGTKSISVKTAKKRLAFVDDEFTHRDLLNEMNKRRVFGEYSPRTMRKVLTKGVRCNLIERIGNGVYKKI